MAQFICFIYGSIVTKALRTFIKFYPFLKSERLSTKLKLTLHKALLRSKMTYTCPAWEFLADNHLLKLLRPQNRVLRNELRESFSARKFS